jgi:hypothetical protein
MSKEISPQICVALEGHGSEYNIMIGHDLRDGHGSESCIYILHNYTGGAGMLLNIQVSGKLKHLFCGKVFRSYPAITGIGTKLLK